VKSSKSVGLAPGEKGREPRRIGNHKELVNPKKAVSKGGGGEEGVRGGNGEKGHQFSGALGRKKGGKKEPFSSEGRGGK